MAGVGSLTNPIVAIMFGYLFFKTWNVVALYGFVMMVALWFYGDPVLITWVFKR